MFTILRLSGLESPHLTTYMVMYYGVACITLTMFYWCTIILEIVHGQLTSCRTGRLKKFGGSLSYSLFFERMPTLSPWVELPSPSPKDPWMAKCTKLWYDLGGGSQKHQDVGFFLVDLTIVCYG